MKAWHGLAAAALALAVTARGGDAAARIAVVNMVDAVRAHPDTKEADYLLEKQMEEVEQHQSEMMAEQERLKKEFESAREEAASRALSEDGRAAKVAAAEKKLGELTEYAQKARKTIGDERRQLADRKSRMQSRIVGKIQEVVAELAKKEQYSLVLDSSGVGANGIALVAYSDAKADLTPAVIEVLKKQAASKPEEKKPEEKAGGAAAAKP